MSPKSSVFTKADDLERKPLVSNSMYASDVFAIASDSIKKQIIQGSHFEEGR